MLCRRRRRRPGNRQQRSQTRYAAPVGSHEVPDYGGGAAADLKTILTAYTMRFSLFGRAMLLV